MGIYDNQMAARASRGQPRPSMSELFTRLVEAGKISPEQLARFQAEKPQLFPGLQPAAPGDTGAATPLRSEMDPNGPLDGSPVAAQGSPIMGQMPTDPAAGNIQMQARSPSAELGGQANMQAQMPNGLEAAMAAPEPTAPQGERLPITQMIPPRMPADLASMRGMPIDPNDASGAMPGNLPAAMRGGDPFGGLSGESPAPERIGFDDKLPEGLETPVNASSAADEKGMMSNFGDFMSSDKGQDWARMGFDFFSNMAKASSKKGQTLGGSIGEGATAAAEGYDKRRTRKEETDWRSKTREEDTKFRERQQSQTEKYQDATTERSNRQLTATIDAKEKELGLMEKLRQTQQFSAEQQGAYQKGMLDLNRDKIKLQESELGIMKQRADKGDKDAERSLFTSAGNLVEKQVDNYLDAAKLDPMNPRPPTPDDVNKFRAETEWKVYGQTGQLGKFLQNQGYDKDTFKDELEGQINKLRNTKEISSIGKDGRPTMVPFPEEDRNARIRELRAKLNQGMSAFGN